MKRSDLTEKILDIKRHQGWSWGTGRISWPRSAACPQF